MLNVNELLKELEVGEYGVEFENYNGGYICDIISQIADNNTSIYYCDIIKFISENVEQVNDTIAEFGWDGCGRDLHKAGQLAEYCFIQNEIYQDIEDILLNYAYKYYVQCTDTTELTEKLNDIIIDVCGSNPDRLEEITEAIDEYLEDCEEFRICSECGCVMDSGYVIDNGEEYYCNDECLYKNYTKEQYEEMYEDNLAYYTEWE